MCIQFYRKGYLGLKNHINFILATKEKKTEEELPKMENVEDYSDKINQKTIDKILKLRTPKNFRTDFKGVIAKDDINYQDNYSNNQKSINKLEIYNFRGNDVNTNNYHLETNLSKCNDKLEIDSKGQFYCFNFSFGARFLLGISGNCTDDNGRPFNIYAQLFVPNMHINHKNSYPFKSWNKSLENSILTNLPLVTSKNSLLQAIYQFTPILYKSTKRISNRLRGIFI